MKTPRELLQRLAALLLLASAVALLPLAYASPPDPTWIGGLYDDADYDDVVLAVTSVAGTIEVAPAPTGAPNSIVLGVVRSRSDGLVVSPSTATPQTRAPPSV